MRLNRFLAACGLGSRRACEEIIAQRRVLINGEEITELASQVKPEDIVIVDGRKVKPVTGTTLIMNKPPGVLTSREDETGNRRDTIYNLLPPNMHSLHYVGRLDYESEGLLIVTSSGDLTEKLTHPRFGIEKEYLIKLHKPFDYEEHGPQMLEGYEIEGGFAKATAVELVSPRVISLVLTQGIKRQIRYMLEALGYHVRRLQRVRIGGFVMPELKSGRWRVLTEEEISLLTHADTERFRLPEKAKKAAAKAEARKKATSRRRPSSSRQQKAFTPGRNARNDNYDQRPRDEKRSARPARTPRPERTERSERAERPARSERPFRSTERSSERSFRSERPFKSERSDRSERSSTTERASRPFRDERSSRSSERRTDERRSFGTSDRRSESRGSRTSEGRSDERRSYRTTERRSDERTRSSRPARSSDYSGRSERSERSSGGRGERPYKPSSRSSAPRRSR
jgi:23S rRNA pseudouridine2605 synthase